MVFSKLLHCATLLFLFNSLSINSQAQKNKPVAAAIPSSYEALTPQNLSRPSAYAERWADSILSNLSLDEKIAQLLMIRTYSNRDEGFNNSIDQLITKFGIGGLCFFQGNALQQLQLTNEWQSCSKVPLLIAMDAENGPGMRLTGAFSYPDFMTMGAVSNNHLITLSGYRTGIMCRSIGVHINFSPVADVNNNPLNPVIHMRSFGESPAEVARKAAAFAHGLHLAGVIATAKHFPGHGDTDADSHYTLPLLKKQKEELSRTELKPFIHLIKNNIPAIMVGHLTLPALDTTPNLAATFSRPIVNELLQNELKFEGLVITDGLDMKGATIGLEPGIPALKALEAGADILLLPADAEAAIKAISKAVADSLISKELVEKRCRRILLAKYYATVRQPDYHEKPSVAAGEPVDRIIRRQILKQAAVLIKNERGLIPFQHPDTLEIAVVNCGTGSENPFTDRMNCYAHCAGFALPAKPEEDKIRLLASQLQKFRLIIFNVVSKNQGPGRDYGVAPGTALLHQILTESEKQTAIILCGSPYGASRIPTASKAKVVVISPDNSDETQELIPQLLFGAIPFQGQMPVSLEGLATGGEGITTSTNGRLEYAIPEELGIDLNCLARIDSVAREGIEAGAYPGCQIELAAHGKVFYRKAFGTLESGGNQPVKPTDLYDLASLTKILATTPAVMMLNQNKELDINLRLGHYLPLVNSTKLKQIKITDILTHQAGLQPWIPFYQKLLPNRQRYFADSLTAEYSVKVADKMFARTSYPDTLIDIIIHSPLNTKQGYKYSDLGFILIKETIENLVSERFDKWLSKNIYTPLSLHSLCFKPWTRFSSSAIAPTENDTIWRRQILRGYVHDQAAALMGGVAGHAGLFGNANDITIMMQLFLNGGSYGGIRLFDNSTVSKFTSRPENHHNNRRALGFDKPLIDNAGNGPVCPEATPESFGHSGFTGTYTWADPGNQLVYTFLSNRVSPDAGNQKLIQLNIRTRIHALAYKALSSAVPPNISLITPDTNSIVRTINNSSMCLFLNTWH